ISCRCHSLSLSAVVNILSGRQWYAPIEPGGRLRRWTASSGFGLAAVVLQLGRANDSSFHRSPLTPTSLTNQSSEWLHTLRQAPAYQTTVYRLPFKDYLPNNPCLFLAISPPAP